MIAGSADGRFSALIPALASPVSPLMSRKRRNCNAADVPLVAAHCCCRTFWQGRRIKNGPIGFVQTLQVRRLVSTAQQIRTNDGAVSAATNNLVTGAFHQRPRIEIVVLAEPQIFIVAQPMRVQKRAPHDRLEEADLTARCASLGDVTFDEAFKIEKVWFRMKKWHDRLSVIRAFRVDEHNVVGD